MASALVRRASAVGLLLLLVMSGCGRLTAPTSPGGLDDSSAEAAARGVRALVTAVAEGLFPTAPARIDPERRFTTAQCLPGQSKIRDTIELPIPIEMPGAEVLQAAIDAFEERGFEMRQDRPHLAANIRGDDQFGVGLRLNIDRGTISILGSTPCYPDLEVSEATTAVQLDVPGGLKTASAWRAAESFLLFLEGSAITTVSGEAAPVRPAQPLWSRPCEAGMARMESGFWSTVSPEDVAQLFEEFELGMSVSQFEVTRRDPSRIEAHQPGRGFTVALVVDPSRDRFEVSGSTPCFPEAEVAEVLADPPPAGTLTNRPPGT